MNENLFFVFFVEQIVAQSAWRTSYSLIDNPKEQSGLSRPGLSYRRFTVLY